MDCPTEPRLTCYLHGELAPGEMRALTLHLEGCPECRAKQQALRPQADAVIPLYLLGYVHDELDDRERHAVRDHLAYCAPCREEQALLRETSHELIKNLAQYQLAKNFRNLVMRDWKPHRQGVRQQVRRRGLADLIERAEGGNYFTYERHVDRFKDYAYVQAFCAVRDAQWAAEAARELFVAGMPPFPDELTMAKFLDWLRDQSQELARLKAADAGGAAPGLSGYDRSEKLRRLKLILGLVDELAPEVRLPFLLFYMQGLEYGEIAALLELERFAVLLHLDQATRVAAERLASA